MASNRNANWIWEIFTLFIPSEDHSRSAIQLQSKRNTWTLEEASFEKMGMIMEENNGRLLGLYDELSSFLTGINLYNSKGISDSHNIYKFLQLYNGHPRIRRTGLYV